MKKSEATTNSMRRAGRLLVIVSAFFAVLGTAKVDAQPYFKRLSTDDGLSCSIVHDICHDPYGFIWIATSYGLCRYDGTRFKTYYKEDIDVYSNYIITLCTDNEGNLWIGTDKGVTVYDIHTDSFTNFNRLTGHTILNKVPIIQKDDNGNMWIAVNRQGIFRVEPKTYRTENYLVENGVQTIETDISAMYIDSKSNQYLVGVYYGNLYQADSTFTRLTPYRQKDGTEPFAGANIKTIARSHVNHYYIAYDNDRIGLINPYLKSCDDLNYKRSNKTTIKKIYPDSDHRLWIATNDGLYLYHALTEKTEHFRYSAIDNFSLPDDNVLCIHEDSRSGIWVGTYGSGIGTFHDGSERFRKVYQAGDELLTGCRTRCFAEDKNGLIYVGTEQKGVFVYSPAENRLEKYRHAQLPENIMTMLVENDNLWGNSKQGIFRLNTETGRLKTYQIKDNIYTIYRTSSGEIIAGGTLGLQKYDAAADRFDAIESFNSLFIDDIIEDSQGNLWYGTFANGLYKSNERNEITAHYQNDYTDANSLPGDKVMTICEDSHGSIWASAHGTGISRLEGDRFVVYNQSSGLSNNIVYDIMEDDAGWLWITTDNGLTSLDPVTLQSKIYTTANGLLNNDFNYNAGLKTRSGEIMLGSRDGFISFNPAQFKQDTLTPKIVFTSLSVNNQIMKPLAEGSPLRRSIAETRRIELSSTQNTLGFDISILDFDSSDNTAVYYKLERYNDDWQRLDDNRSLSFTKLPAGRYRLFVKGVSNNGVWNHDVEPIEIVINPAVWFTPAAYVVYILLLMLLIYWIVGMMQRRYVKRQERQRLTLEHEKEIELYNEKISFFSNIAHEIKTPLTLIKLPLDNIIKSANLDEADKEDVALIDQNTQYLIQLINELLDFTKIERNGYRLNCELIDLVEFIEFCWSNFQLATQKRQLQFEFTHTADHVYVRADRAGLIKIVNNLFSNAIKYAGNYLRIAVSVDLDKAVVSFCNDGEIIPIEQRQAVFAPFVQCRAKEQANTNGFGIGLSVARMIAELHGGHLSLDEDTTCNNFTLTLPLATEADEVKEADETAAESVGDEVTADDEGQQYQTVLIVEDNEQLCGYLDEHLSKRYKVYTASNGEQALEIAEQKSDIDIIVSDISMPGMDGLELCSTLKNNLTFSHIPIIMLSAHMSNQIKIKSMDVGADMYIEKPFAMDYLISCIDNLLNKRQSLVEYYRHRPIGSITSESPAQLPYDELSPLDAKFIEQLDQAVADNLPNHNYSITQLADTLCLSKSTLNRKMKGVLNMTPNDYIRVKRLIKAAEMIAAGEKQIKEVSYLVGFQTPSYFIKCFKSYFGILPSEYISQMKSPKGVPEE